MDEKTMIKEAELRKEAAEVIQHLVADSGSEGRENSKVAYEEYSQDVIRTRVREGSIAEQILPSITVDVNHKNVQRHKDIDGFYYMEDVEVGAVAMETDVRSTSKASFVNSAKYVINIGKLKSERVKKPQLELASAPKLLDMIKVNSTDMIIRTQDAAFMDAVTTAATFGSWSTGNHYATADWQTGADKNDIVKLMSLISDQELIPAKFLMSNSCWTYMLTEEGTNFGDEAGERLYKGHKYKTLFNLPVITTVKEQLNRRSQYFFTETSTTSAGTDKYHYIYCFVDPSFLGKIIRVYDDNVWSQWEADIFNWESWRYVGMGFGDSRGIVRLKVQVS